MIWSRATSGTGMTCGVRLQPLDGKFNAMASCMSCGAEGGPEPGDGVVLRQAQ